MERKDEAVHLQRYLKVGDIKVDSYFPVKLLEIGVILTAHTCFLFQVHHLPVSTPRTMVSYQFYKKNCANLVYRKDYFVDD